MWSSSAPPLFQDTHQHPCLRSLPTNDLFEFPQIRETAWIRFFEQRPFGVPVGERQLDYSAPSLMKLALNSKQPAPTTKQWWGWMPCPNTLQATCSHTPITFNNQFVAEEETRQKGLFKICHCPWDSQTKMYHATTFTLACHIINVNSKQTNPVSACPLCAA